MDSKVYTRKRKRDHQQTFELLDVIVWEILIRLPVESLLRFKSVSKAWLGIISDPSFVLAHLQCSKQRQHRNPSSFLVTPHFQDEHGRVTPLMLDEPGTVRYIRFHDEQHGPVTHHMLDEPGIVTDIRFYRWSLEEGRRGIATLVYRKHFPAIEFGQMSTVAHCDGLMLVPTDIKAYVFNPATKDGIALPESQRDMVKHDGCLPAGLGLDTSTGKYKVARAFYRSCSSDAIAMGMEVFTINGEEESWRETLVDPPYPILDSQTATHFKGNLFFYMNEEEQQYPPQGLLRFSLVNETFGVTPLPPAYILWLKTKLKIFILMSLAGNYVLLSL